MAKNYYGAENVVSHGDFFQKSPDDFRNVSFVSGHFGYEFAKQLMPGRFSFTFLRDPEERLVSHYYYLRAQDPPQYEPAIVAKRCSLEDFLKELYESPLYRSNIWNNQVWQMAYGYAHKVSTKENISISRVSQSELLQRACDNLKKLDFVGFTESFDDDILFILKKLRLPKPEFVSKLNVSKQKLTMEAIPASTRALLREFTELDRQLYNFAKRHLERS